MYKKIYRYIMDN